MLGEFCAVKRRITSFDLYGQKSGRDKEIWLLQKPLWQVTNVHISFLRRGLWCVTGGIGTVIKKLRLYENQWKLEIKYIDELICNRLIVLQYLYLLWVILHLSLTLVSLTKRRDNFGNHIFQCYAVQGAAAFDMLLTLLNLFPKPQNFVGEYLTICSMSIQSPV